MKSPVCLLLLLGLGLSSVSFISGCSKEAAAAKKVDVSAMTQALKGEDKDARINACIELAKAGPRAKGAVPALIPLLKDPDTVTRRLAAYALGQIGPDAKEALTALRDLTADPDRTVMMQAVNSLRSIDPKAYSGMKNETVNSP